MPPAPPVDKKVQSVEMYSAKHALAAWRNLELMLVIAMYSGSDFVKPPIHSAGDGQPSPDAMRISISSSQSISNSVRGLDRKSDSTAWNRRSISLAARLLSAMVEAWGETLSASADRA